MADIKTAYGTAEQSIDLFTANPCNNGAWRESDSVDNTSNLFLDAICRVRVGVGAGTPGTDKCVYVYVYGLAGTTYPEGTTGNEGTFTAHTGSENLVLAGVVNITAASQTRDFVFSVANCFGGTLPSIWGVVVFNNCGINTTKADDASYASTCTYQGVYATVA